MKSPAIVAAAVMIGFVSVLVYRVSASDAMGLGQLPAPVQSIAVAADAAPPMAVEFIVQQCDIPLSDALRDVVLTDLLETASVAAPAKMSAATSIFVEQWVVADGVPEFVLEDTQVAERAAATAHSPSIVYVR